MLHYKTQLYILGEKCSESREMASRDAKLSGRKAITLPWGAVGPVGGNWLFEGLAVAFWNDGMI